MYLITEKSNASDEIAHVIYADDLDMATAYANEIVEEEGKDAVVYKLIASHRAEDNQINLDSYNGVKRGVDYPASLGV